MSARKQQPILHRDFVVYHNPDGMGYPVEEATQFTVSTNNPVFASDVTGSRVWVITGDGKPRSFRLYEVFTVSSIREGRDPKFATELSGAEGHVFENRVELNGLDWFKEFKRANGNFSFGFKPIRDCRALEGLLQLLEDDLDAARPAE